MHMSIKKRTGIQNYLYMFMCETQIASFLRKLKLKQQQFHLVS